MIAARTVLLAGDILSASTCAAKEKARTKPRRKSRNFDDGKCYAALFWQSKKKAGFRRPRKLGHAPRLYAVRADIASARASAGRGGFHVIVAVRSAASSRARAVRRSRRFFRLPARASGPSCASVSPKIL
jgi:hypothetical protein